VYWKYFHFTVFTAPAGMIMCLTRRTDARIFVAAYFLVAGYFSAKMVRLVLLLGPAGGYLRTSTRPTVNRLTESALLYEHSPCMTIFAEEKTCSNLGSSARSQWPCYAASAVASGLAVGALLDWCAHECATMGEIQPAALAAAAQAKEVRPARYCPPRHSMSSNSRPWARNAL